MTFGIALGTNVLAQTAQGKENFAGTWESKTCRSDKSRMFCYKFMLYLLQTGNDICGAHSAVNFSGPTNPITHQINKGDENFGKIDEGHPGSIIGAIINNTATFVIRSGRTGEYYMARALINRRKMEWNLVGRFTGTEEDVDEMLPQKTTLTRSPEKFNFVSNDNKPINLKNSCNWPTFNPTFNDPPRSQR
jgi:hypothetical protein